MVPKASYFLHLVMVGKGLLVLWSLWFYIKYFKGRAYVDFDDLHYCYAIRALPMFCFSMLAVQLSNVVMVLMCGLSLAPLEYNFVALIAVLLTGIAMSFYWAIIYLRAA